MKRLFEKTSSKDGHKMTTISQNFSDLIKSKEKEALNGQIKEYLFSESTETKSAVIDNLLNPSDPKGEEEFLLNLLTGQLGIKTKNTRVEKLINEHLFKKEPETRDALKNYIKENFSKDLTKALLTNYLVKNRV